MVRVPNEALVKALLAGFPERVGLRRSEQGERVLLANGQGARLRHPEQLGQQRAEGVREFGFELQLRDPAARLVHLQTEHLPEVTFGVVGIAAATKESEPSPPSMMSLSQWPSIVSLPSPA